MQDTAKVLSFPAEAIVRQVPKPRPPQKEYSLSPEAKWMFYRAIRDDASLSMDAVLAAGHLLDFYSQPVGYSAPSLGSFCKACRFFKGKHRRHDQMRAATALNQLIDAGYILAEKYEMEPGSGYPGWKFRPRHQRG